MSNVKLKIAISAIGKISSGKSTFAKYLSQKYNIPVASFGGYVKHHCEQKGLPIDRDTLQNVGLSLVRANPEDFLSRVIDFYAGNSPFLIFDGVRNATILAAVKAISEKSMYIYVSTNLDVRFQRYLARGKSSDQAVTFDEFVKIDDHQIEREIESLQKDCDAVIDGNSSYEENEPKMLNTLLSQIGKNTS
jgi:dephospho-CoA kinase